jgi:hypothetical protein
MKKSLSLFICALILVIKISLTFSITIQSSLNLTKEIFNSKRLNFSIKSKQKNSNSSSSLNSLSYGESVSSFPDFKNRGYKCIKINPINKDSEISQCPQGDTKCTSKGALIYGPNSKGDMVLKYPFKDSYSCNPKDLKLEGVDKIFCHSFEPTLSQTLAENQKLTINVFNHAYCALEDTTKYVFVKQGSDFKCEKSAYSIFSDLDKIKTLSCQCFIALFPNDKSLKIVYTPMRISNKDYKCLKANSSVGTVCEGYLNEEICAAKIEDPINVAQIITATSDLIPSARAYYFDRWICPFETGLNVAVRYDRNGSKYTVSCLSRKGKDCFYDELANEACKKVNSCVESKDEFMKLQCGTAEMKSNWDNNGFDTPLDTWCKRANAWLRFDSSIILTTDKSKGLILLPNGITACVPDSDNASTCLQEGEKFALTKLITKYDDDVTLFKSLLKCDVKAFPESTTDSNHWCAQSMILPSDKGEFDIGLSDVQK